MSQPLETHTVDLVPVEGAVSTIPYGYMTAPEIAAYFYDDAGALVSSLTYGVDFTVSPVGRTSANQGQITLLTPVPATATILRVRGATDPKSLYQATPGAEGVEADLARIAMFLQQNLSGIAEAEIHAAAALTYKLAAEQAALQVPLFDWQFQWAAGVNYGLYQSVKFNGSSYICIVPHLSTDFTTDIGLVRWDILAERGSAGIGTGDMLNADNLEFLTDFVAAWNRLKQDATTASAGVVRRATGLQMTAGAADVFGDAAQVLSLINAKTAGAGIGMAPDYSPVDVTASIVAGDTRQNPTTYVMPVTFSTLNTGLIETSYTGLVGSYIEAGNTSGGDKHSTTIFVPPMGFYRSSGFSFVYSVFEARGSA